MKEFVYVIIASAMLHGIVQDILDSTLGSDPGLPTLVMMLVVLGLVISAMKGDSASSDSNQLK